MLSVRELGVGTPHGNSRQERLESAVKEYQSRTRLCRLGNVIMCSGEHGTSGERLRFARRAGPEELTTSKHGIDHRIILSPFRSPCDAAESPEVMSSRPSIRGLRFPELSESLNQCCRLRRLPPLFLDSLGPPICSERTFSELPAASSSTL